MNEKGNGRGQLARLIEVSGASQVRNPVYFLLDGVERKFYNATKANAHDKTTAQSKSMPMQNTTSVKEFIASLDEQTLEDSQAPAENKENKCLK